MSIERALFAFAGIMVMVSALLTMLHHPNWVWLTLLIGANCFQSAFTGFCPPSLLLRRMGFKTEVEMALDRVEHDD